MFQLGEGGLKMIAPLIFRSVSEMMLALIEKVRYQQNGHTIQLQLEFKIKRK